MHTSAALNLTAGTSIASVTPKSAHLTQGELFLAGYGDYKSRRAVAEIHDDIFVRAIALQATDTASVVVATLDLIGLGTKTAEEICREAARQTGLPPSAILLSSSHTHSGPDLLGLWGGVPRAYLEYVISQSVRAIVEASNKREPVRAFVGSTCLGHATTNRRNWDKTDDALVTLQLRRHDSSVLATMISFAAHPVIIGSANRRIASDFVGPLLRAVEENQGGTAIFLPGALGDASPRRPQAPNAYLAARLYGRMLAEGVTAANASARELAPILHVTTQRLPLQITNGTFLRAQQAGHLGAYYTLQCSADEFWIDTGIARVSLGSEGNDLHLFFLPGEPVTRLGNQLKVVMGGEEQMIVGQTSVAIGYLIPDDEWLTNRHRNYEESMALSPEAAGKILKTAIDLFR